MITYACGGYCKHGVMEANYCEACADEFKARGIPYMRYNDDIEGLKAAIGEALGIKPHPEKQGER